MMGHFDVVVIGAGVVGSAIARELAAYNLKLALIEKEVDVSFGTSKANSGIVHAGFHSPAGSLKANLVVPGNKRFDKLREELDFPFERRGELMVAFNEEELRVLHMFFERGRENGVPDLELLGREGVLELEPNLNPDVAGALHAPTAGVICPYEYCFSLVENAVENGLELLLGRRVTWIGKHGNEFSVDTSTGETIKTRNIINAAGLYADEIAAHVGLTDFKIVARKGEEYLLDRRVGGLVSRVIFPVPDKQSKGMLVIPTVDGPVMVGPTAEDIESKDDYSTTSEGLKAVFQHAQKMVPSIRSTDAITSFVGLRPTATGGDFIIGPTKVPGFFNAAGIQSPGLTASPAIATFMVDVLKNAGVPLKHKKSFNPIRKRSSEKVRLLIEQRKYEELGALVEKEPKYGKLVCRCENVTEAEIADAVRRGHNTMDGVKFATRAGTGRCQGGFCSCGVMKIIEKESGIPIEEISKKGPGSEIFPLKTKKGCCESAGGAR